MMLSINTSWPTCLRCKFLHFAPSKIQFSQIWYLQKMMKRKQCAYKCCFILGKGIAFCESTNTARASTLILSCVNPRQRFILETCFYIYKYANFRLIFRIQNICTICLAWRNTSVFIELSLICIVAFSLESRFTFPFLVEVVSWIFQRV